MKANLKNLKTTNLPALASERDVDLGALPYCIQVLLENVLRHQDAHFVNAGQIEALAHWDPQGERTQELAFHPGRVVLQDFTGVPAVVDLAAMRDAMEQLGGDAADINPLFPAELVIDHSVQVDSFGTVDALRLNRDKEYERNDERYQLLRWAQESLSRFQVVPPATGIVHQVNLERLARVVIAQDGVLYPDTLVGTDSHTTMINGIGILGWGVGGIEAEAAMLGQPINLLVPDVIGVRLVGEPPPGTTATDVVLTLTERLRAFGVVSKFVEFFGAGLDHIGVETRATISNMSPEFGSTCAIFPVDAATISYLKLTGRDEDNVALVEAYFREQQLFRTTESPEAVYTDVIDVDLAEIEPSISGPKRPQDRIPLSRAKASWRDTLAELEPRADAETGANGEPVEGTSFILNHGDVAIAAITSCTNTSNPHVMIVAALVARKASEKGLKVQPWVKTSLAPGSKVVTRYLRESQLLDSLEELGFHVVGYGCTTCIGNSGPLAPEVSSAVDSGDLVVTSVLSGNRNFEGRINPDVRANYLASPPLVVAYALAGTMNRDLTTEPLGQDPSGADVYLRDIWPTEEEVNGYIARYVGPEFFQEEYETVFDGDERWRSLPTPEGSLYAWDEASSYVRRPPFFDGLNLDIPALQNIVGARALLVLGDSVTTDHISPAGAIGEESAAGKYLIERGIPPHAFNSYGSRRGNHEVMMRGTFANIRIRNRLVPGVEGGFSRYLPDGTQGTIFEVAERYRKDGTPLIVLAGKEYGSGSSRDWAAKGTLLLGIRAVIAESYERIHRSNLVGMGVLPLEFVEGASTESLEFSGEESFSIAGVETSLKPGGLLEAEARGDSGKATHFRVKVRIDTEAELAYYRHGGILPFVLRQLAASKQ